MPGRNNNDFHKGPVPVTFRMRSKDGGWSGSATFMSTSSENAKAQARDTGYEVEDEGTMHP
jgi:hypothetical protein